MFCEKPLSMTALLVISGVFAFLGEAIAPPRGYVMKNPPELEAKLTLFKKNYLVREPIWVRVQVTNIGTEEGDFYFMTSDRLTIRDSKGKLYPSNIHVEYMGPVTIGPNETLEDEFEILASYGLPQHHFANGWWWFFPPNRYTVYYELSYLLKETVESPLDSFEVLEPKGDEITAMYLLVDSFNLLKGKNTKEALERLDELIEQYPQSVYSPFALSRKMSIYAIYLEDSKRALTVGKELIEDYPDSREAVAAVQVMSAIYQAKEDKNAFTNAMNDLIREYPDTDISREAQKQLDQVKDKEFE